MSDEQLINAVVVCVLIAINLLTVCAVVETIGRQRYKPDRKILVSAVILLLLNNVYLVNTL